MELRVKMSVPKDQLRVMLEETLASNMKVMDIFVRTKERENIDFDEIVFDVEITPPIIQSR